MGGLGGLECTGSSPKPETSQIFSRPRRSAVQSCPARPGRLNSYIGLAISDRREQPSLRGGREAEQPAHRPPQDGSDESSLRAMNTRLYDTCRVTAAKPAVCNWTRNTDGSTGL